MTSTISVIVPIYNQQEYLDKCIQSIVGQTYADLEIILVDDGSTDNSPILCDAWRIKDNRIRVLHKKNGGLSTARNAGLEIATGAYITFVDSDDWIAQDMYELLISNIHKHHAEVSICSNYKVFGNQNRRPEIKDHIFLEMDSCEAFKKVNEIGYFGVAVWDKICASYLFKDLRFPIGRTNEDYWVTYTLLDRAKKIIYDSTPKYFYRQQKNSITHSCKIDFNSVESTAKMMDLVSIKYPSALPYAQLGHTLALMGIYDTMLRSADNHSEWKKIKKETQYFIRKHYKSIMLRTDTPFPRRLQMVLIGWASSFYPPIFSVYRSWKHRGIN